MILISPNVMTVFFIFIYGFQFFIIFLIYNVLLFLLKSTFWSKFIIFYILSKELYESLPFIIRCFFSFCNIFFCTQQAFVFHPQRDFCNAHDHINSFFSYSSLERFWYLSWAFFVVFLYFLDNTWKIKF